MNVPPLKSHRGGQIVALAAIVLFWALNWVAVWPLLTDSHQQGAKDFSIFYTGAKIIRAGLSAHLYDLSVQAHFQTAVYQTHPLPFDHLAYEAILFLPFVGMSFGVAYWTWFAMCIGIAGVISWLLAPHLAAFPRPATLWVFAAAMASFPLLWTLCEGQDSIILLLIFVLVYINLKKERDVIAGLVLATALFKFPLVLPFAVAFMVRRQWRFVSGFLAGSTVVGATSLAVTGIGGVRDYARLLSELVVNPAMGYINPLLMPNARGFLLTMLAGSGISRGTFDAVSSLVSIILVVVPCVMFRGREHLDRFDLWFGLNLSVALLAAPHLYWHDLTPLLLPLFLATNLLLKNGMADGFAFSVITAFCLFAAAWLAYLAPLGTYPSILFIPFCLFALILATKLHSLRPRPGRNTAMEAVAQ